jgi:hypothetical protein
MQYVFRVTGTGIQGQVQYWDVPAFQSCFASETAAGIPFETVVKDCSKFETFAPFAVDIPLWKSLPIQNSLPAGYSLNVTLANDSGGNVTGATFTVTDDNGATSSTTIPVDAGVRFPVQAFELDVVGPGDGSAANFFSGAGAVSYTASNGSLCVQGASPDTCTGNSTSTGETSNANYAAVTSCCGSPATQQISISPPSSRFCFVKNGQCTGAFGDRCITLNGVTQCCHSNLPWGWFPWIEGCTDGTVLNMGCGGPCE